MKEYFQCSLTRLLANIFLCLVLCVALVMAVYQVLNRQEINPLCSTAITMVATYAIATLASRPMSSHAKHSVLVAQSEPDATMDDTVPMPRPAKQFKTGEFML